MCIGTENKEKNRDRDKDRDRHRCMRAKSLQSCLTLCDPMDRSLPGSSVHGFSRKEYWSGLPFPSFLVWNCEHGPIQCFLLALEGELRACSCGSTSQSAPSEEGSVVQTGLFCGRSDCGGWFYSPVSMASWLAIQYPSLEPLS